MSNTPIIRSSFDEATNTVSYIVIDPLTREAVVIDPVLDYDHAAGTAETRSVERLLRVAEDENCKIKWSLETHAHADHLSGSPFIKAKTGARIGIGEGIKDVQKIFRPIFDDIDLETDGSDFDHLFADGEVFSIGDLACEVVATPGHTPADISYKIGDAVFVGDTLFMPDYGTARADFPGGNVHQLYWSIKRILSMPAHTRLYMCHDYMAPGRSVYAWEATVGEQRSSNVHVHDGVTEEEFVAMRTARDAKLSTPRLLLPSIQVNIRAGKFPAVNANGVHYLTIPVTLKGSSQP